MLCKICGSPKLVQFISFGEMPVANAFLKKEDLEKPEYKYEMAVGFCEDCKMVQLINIVPYNKYIVPDNQGKTNYAFFSSTSKFMENHFAELAKEVEDKFLKQGDKVIEIGSNDGILLKAFKNNIVLGVEPSHNVADVAISQGIDTLKEFFSENLARKLVKEKGKFKAAFTTNVFLNIIDLHDFLKGINELLEDNGIFVTEDPYIPSILEKNSYDQIYDEHIWYFSLTSLSNLFKMHGLEIFDAEKLWVHGGSMRVYTCKIGKYEKTQRLKDYFEEEKQKGIDTLSHYNLFARNVEQSKNELYNIVMGLKAKGKKIVGYAAASKGTIVLNYCNLGKNVLDYISDSTPFKQGLFSPGKHIPIVAPEFFNNDNADYALLSAWNHAQEIMEKEKNFIARGGRFIVHLPKPRILEPGELIEEKRLEEIKTKKLKVFADDEGYLFETLRNDDDLFDNKFGQVLVSVLYPGVIKGLHRHSKQTDYTTCIKGNVKYIAIKEENGKIDIKTFIIGESNPILIKVPSGYWHGYMPLGNERAIILHTMDKPYNPQDPDTDEINHFSFGDIWNKKN